jgi:hypothetical protein
MFEVLKEIRDDIRTGTLSTFVAESGTSTTTIKITNHGLNNGDNITNVTRSLSRAVTVVDANTVTVTAITGQVAGDTITSPFFKHYYVGDINDNTAINELPVLCVIGNQTQIQQKSTVTDRWKYDVLIEAYTNPWKNVSQYELADDILLSQKEIQEIFEKRGGNNAPLATTILGIVRKNIQGHNYLFNDDIVINYKRESLAGKIYFKAMMKLSFYSMAYPRS